MTTLINKKSKQNWIIPVIMLGTLVFQSCTKNDDVIDKKKKPSQYSAEVLDKWMTLQMRLMRNATGIPNHSFGRHFAYTGVAALEAIEPALHGKKEWSDKWNGLTGLPASNPSKDYYYPANVNAAVASMNRLMFPNASVADKAAIDSLETALNQEFLTTEPADLVNASTEFGKQVASAVYNWSESDGYKGASSPYQVPVGFGLWKPTAPAFAAPATPYWGNNRTVMKGSIDGARAAAPIAYSDEAQSPFYLMARDVYEASRNLTDDQKAMANFWKDVPGATTPGHWISVMQQLIRRKSSSLETAALAYALSGTAINDAAIVCFKDKYQHNVVRPITYIREIFGYSTWNSFIGTPAHPEYVSAHSSLSMATARVLEKLFPLSGTFTDHTYDYLGYAPRTYYSIVDMAVEAGQSRFFAGIHYVPSINAGFAQGNIVALNIFKK
jgi:hypothetical protein